MSLAIKLNQTNFLLTSFQFQNEVSVAPAVLIDIPIVVVTIPHDDDEALNINKIGWQKGYENFRFKSVN